jgi:uncharacterized protein YciI
MPVFFCRMNPPRADFAQTMTEAERALMGRHAAYLKAAQEKGIAVLFGPVGDPKGAWGLCVLECADMAEARGLTDNDPTVQSGQDFSYEVYPILSANLRASLQRS